MVTETGAVVMAFVPVAVIATVFAVLVTVEVIVLVSIGVVAMTVAVVVDVMVVVVVTGTVVVIVEGTMVAVVVVMHGFSVVVYWLCGYLVPMPLRLLCMFRRLSGCIGPKSILLPRHIVDDKTNGKPRPSGAG